MNKPTAHPDRGVACSLRGLESQEHQRRRMVEAGISASSRGPASTRSASAEVRCRGTRHNVLVQSCPEITRLARDQSRSVPTQHELPGLTAIQEYGYAASMKATIEIPDELYRRVKAKSALEGRPVRAVAVELLRTWVGDPLDQAVTQPPSLHDRMQNYCGMVDSGVTDLATNPEYLADFGHGSTGHR